MSLIVSTPIRFSTTALIATVCTWLPATQTFAQDESYSRGTVIEHISPMVGDYFSELVIDGKNPKHALVMVNGKPQWSDLSGVAHRSTTTDIFYPVTQSPFDRVLVAKYRSDGELVGYELRKAKFLLKGSLNQKIMTSDFRLASIGEQVAIGTGDRVARHAAKNFPLRPDEDPLEVLKEQNEYRTRDELPELPLRIDDLTSERAPTLKSLREQADARAKDDARVARAKNRLLRLKDLGSDVSDEAISDAVRAGER